MIERDFHVLGFTAAYLCEWVYGDEEWFSASDLGAHTERCVRFEHRETDSQGVLVKLTFRTGATHIFLVLRGTEIECRKRAALDVMLDLAVYPLRADGGFVHSGFYLAAKGVQEVLPAGVGADTIVTGHSLGGAVAQHIAIFNGCERIITFGAPAIATPGYSLPENTRHWRYTQTLDIVPRLPVMPWWRHNAPARNCGNGGHGVRGYVEALQGCC